MAKVLNWMQLQLNEDDLKEVATELETPKKLKVALLKLVKKLLSQHPWMGRNDTVELFQPSRFYEVGEWIALPTKVEGAISAWQIGQVTEVKEGYNPKQGHFQIVRLQVNGQEVALAANIPQASPLPFTMPTDDQVLQELADYFVNTYESTLRQAFLEALEQFSVLIYLSQTDEVALISTPLEDSDADLVAQLFEQSPKVPRSLDEIVAHLRSHERLVSLTDEQAAAAVKELLERNGYVLVGEGEWLSPDGIESVDRDLRRRPPVPVVRDDDEYYERVELPEEGQVLAEEFGEEEEAAEEELSLDEWRERTQTEPLKLPPLTFQNIVEAYFPLNRQLSEFLPPGSLKKVRLRFRAVNESEPMTFWVSRGERDKRGLKADESCKERFRQWLISEGIPAGTTFWIERISDFEYRLYAKRLDPPRKVQEVKLPSIENGELKFELEEVLQHWEGDPFIFKADLRFEDLEALWMEAEQVGLRIATIVRRVFEQLDPKGTGIHWNVVFNATYLVRMCSPRTVLGILYNQPCFEPLGNGRFRLNREVRLQIVRRPPVRRPAIEHFELPTMIWANRSFVVKVRTRYCQQVTLEYSQDGQNWEIVQTLPANPDGQKTNKFRLSLPEPGQWQLKVTAIIADDRTLTEQKQIQVQSLPAVQPITVKPPTAEAAEEVVTVTLPFTLPQILFPIPFASEPLSESLVRRLEQLTRERLLPPLHPTGQIRLMEGEQPRLSLSPTQADELLQQCVAESGHFVTHRLVADFMVNLAQPKPNESIADICCGSGIFLVKAWRFVKKVYGDDSSVELFGADIRSIACNSAILNLEANGFADPQAVREMDSLSENFGEERFDLILGNPPFDLPTVTSFLTLWMALLKEGGRMVVLVPAGILTGSQQEWIRERLINNGTILAIISLPRLGNIYGAAGNVLFWVKQPPEPDHEPLLISVQNLEVELEKILRTLLFEGVKAKILGCLRENPAGLRTYQLAQILGLNPEEIRTHLSELASSQMVRRVPCDEDGYERWFALR